MAESFASIVRQRFSRRSVLAAGGAAALLGALPRVVQAEGAATASGFSAVPLGAKDRIDLPEGYVSGTVIRWGDPLLPRAPEFDPAAITRQNQMGQFGFNCDYVGYLPLPYGSTSSRHGLLCVSSEYTQRKMMFPDGADPYTRDHCEVEMAAHGLNVLEVHRTRKGSWYTVRGSQRNRRMSAFTPFTLTGPAAGHPRLRTRADSAGRTVIGTVNNCAGGLTPWGTWLQAEENFNGYFRATPDRADADLAEDLRLYGIRTKSSYGWDRFHARFDLDQEPNEANRFGWMVEVDPYDPASQPVKRTALGRFKHEAAGVTVSAYGRLVVYMGDDERDEHIYKFVSKGRYEKEAREANSRLLDEGTLYVAVFEKDGSGRWLALTHGEGPLTRENGFTDQGDVLIRTRKAARLLGATGMDRPEDVEVSPKTGHVYVALTNHSRRKVADPALANPRAPNPHGHILEMREAGDDAAADRFAWDVLTLCGPKGSGASYEDDPQAAVLSCPDNLVFDNEGHLWISTDGQPSTLRTSDDKPANDGVYRVPVTGPDRGKARRFLSAVPHAEVCGPAFTPDNRTFFCAIQHPGGGSFSDPVCRFPDYDDKLPPRPSVIAVWRPDGAPIGT